MEQKEVKIIGLTINEQMGILHSCKLEFNPENNLIPVKGAVGAGKTTLQKGLQLGTLGSETLKDDKALYGKIDEEVQLVDGLLNVFIGCKTNNDGGISYTIYTKDNEGNIDKEPVIDGVKATPATYLKELQTALTWRMDELTSENPTTQRRILLELYRSELASLGVIFDKKDLGYDDSILGQIDRAENTRTEKDFLRKQVGGFAKQLEPFGIHPISHPETVPKRVDISDLEAKKSKLQHDIENVGNAKQMKLDALQNKADAVVVEMKDLNNFIKDGNKTILKDFADKKNQYSQNIHTFNGIKTDLETLYKNDCFDDVDAYHDMRGILGTHFKNESPTCLPEKQVLEFDIENKVCLTTIETWKDGGAMADLLTQLRDYKVEYKTISQSPLEDTTDFEKEMEKVVGDLAMAKEVNRKCDMVDAFLSWDEAHNNVMELKNKYAGMLASVNTGVEGLNICVGKHEESSKMDIYLTYNGQYDVDYFNNEKVEQRKLSSYSGTQKPLICLLLQNYLLSKKVKAMRYLWIDNVPIDNKTKLLLQKMGKELDLTIIVNITGDFTKDNLDAGDILIEGGEVFFN